MHVLRIAFVLIVLMSTGLVAGQEDQEKKEEADSTSRIAYIANKTCGSGCYHIVILNPHTREERIITALINDRIAYFGLTWRPHSDWLTFIRAEDNAHQLAMINTITEEIRPLGHGMSDLVDLAWSPDGSVLALTGLPLGEAMTVPLEAELFLYDAAVGITARFSQGRNTFTNITWSPSGEAIAVDGKISLPDEPREYATYTDILLFERNGEFKVIGSPDVRESSASWTQDGRYIVYAAGDDHGQQLYQADVTSGEVTQLSNNNDWKTLSHLVLQDSAVVYLAPEGYTQTKVQLFDLQTTEVQTVFAGELTVSRLSPDGSQMAIIEIVDDAPKMCVFDLQTTEKWCAQHEPDTFGTIAWG